MAVIGSPQARGQRDLPRVPDLGRSWRFRGRIRRGQFGRPSGSGKLFARSFFFRFSDQKLPMIC